MFSSGGKTEIRTVRRRLYLRYILHTTQLLLKCIKAILMVSTTLLSLHISYLGGSILFHYINDTLEFSAIKKLMQPPDLKNLLFRPHASHSAANK